MKKRTKKIEYIHDCPDCRKEKKSKILRATLLIEANEHLSASASGLREREENRRAALSLLLEVLVMSEEELEKMYWES